MNERDPVFRVYAGRDYRRFRAWCARLSFLPSPSLMQFRSDEGCMTLCAWDIEVCFSISYDGRWAISCHTRSDADEIASRLAQWPRGFQAMRPPLGKRPAFTEDKQT